MLGRMGIFEIDDPDIDVEALEERVRAAIEEKRGVRFTEQELRPTPRLVP